MNEFEQIYYWYIKIFSALFIVLGIFILITGISERTWSYIMIPSGIIGQAWTYVMRNHFSRKKPTKSTEEKRRKVT